MKVLNERYALIENEDGFELEYLMDQLVVVSSNQSYRLEGIEHVLSVQDKLKEERRERQLEDFERRTRVIDSYQKDETAPSYIFAQKGKKYQFVKVKP